MPAFIQMAKSPCCCTSHNESSKKLFTSPGKILSEKIAKLKKREKKTLVVAIIAIMIATAQPHKYNYGHGINKYTNIFHLVCDVTKKEYFYCRRVSFL